MSAYDRRAAWLILNSDGFSMDDITANGAFTLDPTHAPNAGNAGIGGYIQKLIRAGYIVYADRVVRSRAPHRKGGTNRVWKGTDAGKAWAEGELGQKV